MWKPFLLVIAAEAGQALHILGRFHITGHLNQAVDEVRRVESSRLRAKSKSAAQRLKTHRLVPASPWQSGTGMCPAKARFSARQQAAHRAVLGFERGFRYFWSYKSPIWASAFLDYWCYRAMRSRLEPMKKKGPACSAPTSR